MTKKIKINPNESNYIRKLFYEEQTYRNLIGYLLQKENINQNYLDKYEKLYNEAYMIFSIARDELTEMYAKQNNIIHYCESYIDFLENEIIFYYPDGEKTNEKHT